VSIVHRFKKYELAEDLTYGNEGKKARRSGSGVSIAYLINPLLLRFEGDIYKVSVPRRRAGIIGLQTAFFLLEAGFDVTMVAKHWPGDEDLEYTSPR
jgi:hypothetical protein